MRTPQAQTNVNTSELTPRLPDIPYVANGDERQRLDLYLPMDDTLPTATIILIHGGGYVGGDKAQMRRTAEHFREQGYAVMTPGYRLAPEHTFPAALSDIFCATAWLYAHAEAYHLNTENIVLMGESAGANAAALLAAIDDPTPYLQGCAYTLPQNYTFAGVIAYYMPVDLSTCGCRVAKRMAAAYLGTEIDFSQEAQVRTAWADASPLAAIDGSEPPFLLIHGTADSFVPASESRYFVAQTEDMLDVTLVTLDDAQHGFLPPFGEAMRQSLPVVHTFLERILLNDN